MAGAGERAELCLMRAARALRELAERPLVKPPAIAAIIAQDDLFAGVETDGENLGQLRTGDLEAMAPKDPDPLA